MEEKCKKDNILYFPQKEKEDHAGQLLIVKKAILDLPEGRAKDALKKTFIEASFLWTMDQFF